MNAAPYPWRTITKKIRLVTDELRQLGDIRRDPPRGFDDNTAAGMLFWRERGRLILGVFTDGISGNSSSRVLHRMHGPRKYFETRIWTGHCGGLLAVRRLFS
jgi:hypothetical protein